jgi:putative methyltransferase (TIGR04325 family)
MPNPSNLSGRFKRAVRDLLPPLISRPLARRFLDVRYTGDHGSWAGAAQASTGYDAPNILAQVTEAARMVRDGRAAFERDGVLFEKPEFRWPLVACLLREAVKAGGRLRVLDFGGSLGSTYFQNRAALLGVKELKWGVVEQPAFVEVGRREFVNDVLSFHATIDDALRAVAPNVVLFSGVLGWIEDPHTILDRAVAAAVPAIVVDRTPLSPLGRDVAKIQRVPSTIYRASYPCWFLSRERFLAHFVGRYMVRAEFPQIDAPVPGASFAGLYFERIEAGSGAP